MAARSCYRVLNPDSPDEMAFGQLCGPILAIKSNSYAGSSSRIPTDPTGERRNWQFRQRFRSLWSCRPHPSGESGFNTSKGKDLQGLVEGGASFGTSIR